MKRQHIARMLLFVFLTNLTWSCADFSDSGRDLLSNISDRLDQKNYVTAEEFGDTNPHEATGLRMERVYHGLFKYSMFEHPKLVYGTSFVVDKASEAGVKKIVKTELEAQGFVYSEAACDAVAEKLGKYKFTSEDMERYFIDARESKALTPLEYEILMLQMRAVSHSKSNIRSQNIIRTVEYEVAHAEIDQASKDKILLINAIARNLVNDPRISLEGSFPNFFSGNFQQTTPVVVGTFLILAAVGSLIIAWTDPNCNNACQSQMTSNAMAYATAGMLVCAFAANGEPCPDMCYREYGCFRNATGMCICP